MVLYSRQHTASKYFALGDLVTGIGIEGFRLLRIVALFSRSNYYNGAIKLQHIPYKIVHMYMKPEFDKPIVAACHYFVQLTFDTAELVLWSWREHTIRISSLVEVYIRTLARAAGLIIQVFLFGYTTRTSPEPSTDVTFPKRFSACSRNKNVRSHDI